MLEALPTMIWTLRPAVKLANAPLKLGSDTNNS